MCLPILCDERWPIEGMQSVPKAGDWVSAALFRGKGVRVQQLGHLGSRATNYAP
jgi:hypothetical protein